MFYPTSGGMDLEGARPFSEERGCLALKTGDHVFEVVRPSALLFESIGTGLDWTYFWLECEPLEPCGVYEDAEEEIDDGDQDHSPIQSEEVVLVAPGTYAPRAAWDANEFEGEPLPETAQLIVRFLGGGPFVIFSKGSLYNLGRARDFDAYDAPHAKMNAAQFRSFIERFAGIS
jgi:serine/threonine-protein kinase